MAGGAMKKLMILINGKKTWIGAGLLVCGTLLAPRLHIPADIAQLLSLIGTGLGGAGVLHKAIKADDANTIAPSTQQEAPND